MCKSYRYSSYYTVAPEITLKLNVGSDRSWVYSTHADFSEGTPTKELFAIRFANTENAQKFKDAFIAAQVLNGTYNNLNFNEP